jgi:hypothetical protein
MVQNSESARRDHPALDELRTQLQITNRRAGRPPLRETARLTDNKLSASTLSRLFNMKTPPKWENLMELLSALGVPQKEVRATWHPLWMRAMEEDNPLSEPDATTGDLLPAGTRPKGVETCPVCLAWVSDLAGHSRWHVDQQRREVLLQAVLRRLRLSDATNVPASR